MGIAEARSKLEQIHKDLIGSSDDEVDGLLEVSMIADILEELFSRSEEVEDHSHTIYHLHTIR